MIMLISVLQLLLFALLVFVLMFSFKVASICFIHFSVSKINFLL